MGLGPGHHQTAARHWPGYMRTRIDTRALTHTQSPANTEAYATSKFYYLYHETTNPKPIREEKKTIRTLYSFDIKLRENGTILERCISVAH